MIVQLQKATQWRRQVTDNSLAQLK